MLQKIDLCGYWRFAPDLEQRPTSNHNLTEGPVPVYAFPELDRRDWQEVPVPGVWERYGERYAIYEGVCWYCRTFTVSELPEGSRVLLRFGGVAYRADVFVNKTLAWTHESSYTEFAADVTDAVREGENFLAVRVDNRALITKWPNDRGYFAYGGIHRDVTLELYSGSRLEDLEITPYLRLTEGGREGVVKVRGRRVGGGDVPVELECSGARLAVPADRQDGTFSAELIVPEPEVWTPETPRLCLFTVKFDGETYAELKVGFRSVEAKDARVLLNGEPYRLRGVCYVYDSPASGLVMTRRQLLRDLGEMKEAGVNAIRTHYPMDDRFYDLCDEMGFLVWIEPNVYCCKPSPEERDTAFAREDSVAVARSMTREMIAVARRHPCVAVYGIGNECNVEHPEAPAFFRGLAEIARGEDGTRLVGYAALYGLVGGIGEVLDVIGMNSYYGWYDKISDIWKPGPARIRDGLAERESVDLSAFFDVLREAKTRLPERLPILLTEFGADAVPGFHAASEDLWSEEYQAKVIAAMVEASRKDERICGTFVFAFTDYLDPSKPVNGFWNGWNLKGVLTYGRDRRRSFYALREVYRGE